MMRFSGVIVCSVGMLGLGPKGNCSFKKAVAAAKWGFSLGIGDREVGGGIFSLLSSS